MVTGSRERMVRAAAALFQERGYAATSFHDVIARSGAPRGSIYHHFPGGKEQLAAEALRRYAARTTGLLAGRPGETSLQVVAGFLAASRDALRRADFRAGCPVAGVALDLADDADEPLRTVVASAFADWRGAIEKAFARDGAAPALARRLAVLLVAAVEGGLLLARAERDTAPLDDVERELLAHLGEALSAGTGGR